ncbi:glycoside hydrolase family 15 protein [Planctomycetes bacterium Poly30]|uniref:glycoside hydrolase family 15 protein n=1 Tax=Saltatorellus ferox TaxID=2528018 RepID=UPI00119F367A
MKLDHGVIGNGTLLALVNPDTGIDWLCAPRFDSPSLFARLLDEQKGGTWRFLYQKGDEKHALHGEQRYVRNTNVLVTRFEVGDDAWEQFDFMPYIQEGLGHRHPPRIVRYLRPIRGAPRLSMDLDLRPDYARMESEPRTSERGLELKAHGGMNITLHSNVPGPYLASGRAFRLDRGRYFVLDCGSSEHYMHMDEIERDLDLTIATWRRWTQSCSLPGFSDEAVLRSALCLKLHQYSETGAIIAASTTSIPEIVGEPRTWDYRFCWLRDAVFTVEALRRIGHFQEGRDFLQFVLDVADTGELQPLYGIGAERELTEMSLDHLAGFRGTKPVRIGNAAAEQLQTDLMGEVVLCLRTMLTDARVDPGKPELWMPLVERMVREARAAFHVPDLGIWEYRGAPQLHTFSRAMCWAAAHHGAAIALHFGLEDQAREWLDAANEMREEVLERGYSEEKGMFTQTFENEEADAANLLLPSIGLLRGDDPRFLATLTAYRERLVRPTGVMRYVHADDFGEPTSTFTICSFWWAEALALAGELEESIEFFERVLSHANPVGLFSEDIDPDSGELLGNFPQAYTHVGLIHAAMTIGTQLRARSGRYHAWS